MSTSLLHLCLALHPYISLLHFCFVSFACISVVHFFLASISYTSVLCHLTAPLSYIFYICTMHLPYIFTLHLHIEPLLCTSLSCTASWVLHLNILVWRRKNNALWRIQQIEVPTCQNRRLGSSVDRALVSHFDKRKGPRFESHWSQIRSKIYFWIRNISGKSFNLHISDYKTFILSKTRATAS